MNAILQDILKYNPELRASVENDYEFIQMVENEIRRREGISEVEANFGDIEKAIRGIGGFELWNAVSSAYCHEATLTMRAAFIVGYHVAKHPELLIFEQPDLKNAELYPQHLFPNLIATCKARDETAGR